LGPYQPNNFLNLIVRDSYRKIMSVDTGRPTCVWYGRVLSSTSMELVPCFTTSDNSVSVDVTTLLTIYAYLVSLIQQQPLRDDVQLLSQTGIGPTA